MLAEYEGEEQEGTMFVGSTSKASYRHKVIVILAILLVFFFYIITQGLCASILWF